MRIICKLPNASDLINGIKFIAHEAGKISEEVADEVAHAFLAVPGYFKHEAAPIVQQAEAAAAASAESTIAATASVLDGEIKTAIEQPVAEVAPQGKKIEVDLNVLRATVAADSAAVVVDAPAVEVAGEVAAAPAAADAPVADAAPAAATKRAAKKQ